MKLSLESSYSRNCPHFTKKSPCYFNLFFRKSRSTEQARLHWGSVYKTATTGTWHDKWAHLWTSVHSVQYRYKIRQRRWDRILGHSICHVASTRLGNKCRVLLLWHRPLNTFKHWTTHISTNFLHITWSFPSGWYIHWPCYIIKTCKKKHSKLMQPSASQEVMFKKINFWMTQLHTRFLQSFDANCHSCDFTFYFLALL